MKIFPKVLMQVRKSKFLYISKPQTLYAILSVKNMKELKDIYQEIKLDENACRLLVLK